jgi:hypothetical protein
MENITDKFNAIVEHVKQAEIKKKEVLVKRFRPHANHILFEVDMVTGEVKRAELEVQAISFEKASKNDVSLSKKVIMRENCKYISAMNIKNAMKKLGYVVNKNK